MMSSGLRTTRTRRWRVVGAVTVVHGREDGHGGSSRGSVRLAHMAIERFLREPHRKAELGGVAARPLGAVDQDSWRAPIQTGLRAPPARANEAGHELCGAILCSLGRNNQPLGRECAMPPETQTPAQLAQRYERRGPRRCVNFRVRQRTTCLRVMLSCRPCQLDWRPHTPNGPTMRHAPNGHAWRIREQRASPQS